jgi:hypothetical protein
VPQLARLPVSVAGCALAQQRGRLGGGDGFAGANRSRAHARAALRDLRLAC